MWKKEQQISKQETRKLSESSQKRANCMTQAISCSAIWTESQARSVSTRADTCEIQSESEMEHDEIPRCHHLGVYYRISGFPHTLINHRWKM